jgi:hypothetical protein
MSYPSFYRYNKKYAKIRNLNFMGMLRHIPSNGKEYFDFVLINNGLIMSMNEGFYSFDRLINLLVSTDLNPIPIQQFDEYYDSYKKSRHQFIEYECE